MDNKVTSDKHVGDKEGEFKPVRGDKDKTDRGGKPRHVDGGRQNFRRNKSSPTTAGEESGRRMEGSIEGPRRDGGGRGGARGGRGGGSSRGGRGGAGAPRPATMDMPKPVSV